MKLENLAKMNQSQHTFSVKVIEEDVRGYLFDVNGKLIKVRKGYIDSYGNCADDIVSITLGTWAAKEVGLL